MYEVQATANTLLINGQRQRDGASPAAEFSTEETDGTLAGQILDKIRALPDAYRETLVLSTCRRHDRTGNRGTYWNDGSSASR